MKWGPESSIPPWETVHLSPSLGGCVWGALAEKGVDEWGSKREGRGVWGMLWLSGSAVKRQEGELMTSSCQLLLSAVLL